METCATRVLWQESPVRCLRGILWPASAHTATRQLSTLLQVVSTADAAGRVAVLPSLADVQGRNFDTPHILIAERVGGMEDIPVSPLHKHYSTNHLSTALEVLSLQSARILQPRCMPEIWLSRTAAGMATCVRQTSV